MCFVVCMRACVCGVDYVCMCGVCVCVGYGEVCRGCAVGACIFVRLYCGCGVHTSVFWFFSGFHFHCLNFHLWSKLVRTHQIRQHAHILIVSKGCPTNTKQAPPKPPAKNVLIKPGCAFAGSGFACSLITQAFEISKCSEAAKQQHILRGTHFVSIDANKKCGG